MPTVPSALTVRSALGPNPLAGTAVTFDIATSADAVQAMQPGYVTTFGVRAGDLVAPMWSIGACNIVTTSGYQVKQRS